MRELPENKFGYLCLGYIIGKERIGVYVKANKIVTMSYDDVGPHRTILFFGSDDDALCVVDTVDEILEQLENIHPSLR